MQNKDSKATQQAAWARHADIPADKYIPFIIGQIAQLTDMFREFHLSHLEGLADIKVLMEQSLQRLDGVDGAAELLVARPEEDRPVTSKRRTVHISDLVLTEGDWLMDTVEALDVLRISRGTLVSHRDEGLLTEVRIGRKGGGVRFISSEVAGLREWYSVRKGKV